MKAASPAGSRRRFAFHLAKEMLGVLVIILCFDFVSGRSRRPRQREVALVTLLCVGCPVTAASMPGRSRRRSPGTSACEGSGRAAPMSISAILGAVQWSIPDLVGKHPYPEVRAVRRWWPNLIDKRKRSLCWRRRITIPTIARHALLLSILYMRWVWSICKRLLSTCQQAIFPCCGIRATQRYSPFFSPDARS